MVVNEFEPDDIFVELNRKFANVSIDQPTSVEYIYKEIMYDDVCKKKKKKTCILSKTLF
jgi:hypothetical protein